MVKRHGPEDPPDDGDLFRWAESQGSPNDRNTIRDAFDKFNARYPDVYAMFERFALEAIVSGLDVFGAKAVWERLRWETGVRAFKTDAERFHLNNNYTAYYARLFMERHPQYEGVFRTRKVRS